MLPLALAFAVGVLAGLVIGIRQAEATGRAIVEELKGIRGEAPGADAKSQELARQAAWLHRFDGTEEQP